jgi:hypothetical protein
MTRHIRSNNRYYFSEVYLKKNCGEERTVLACIHTHVWVLHVQSTPEFGLSSFIAASFAPVGASSSAQTMN